MTTFDLNSIPDQLSDTDARKILEQAAPRARKQSEDIVRNNTRAEQGQQALARLSEQAQANLGTSDPEEIKRILTERKIANATNVRNYLQALDENEQKLAKVSAAAPGR